MFECACLKNEIQSYIARQPFISTHQSLITSLISQPTISLEMPVPSQGHYGFHSFPVVD